MSSLSVEKSLGARTDQNSTEESRRELLDNLRESLSAIGVDNLSACLRAGAAQNSDVKRNPLLLEKHLDLLKELAETQDLSAKRGSRSLQSARPATGTVTLAVTGPGTAPPGKKGATHMATIEVDDCSPILNLAKQPLKLLRQRCMKLDVSVGGGDRMDRIRVYGSQRHVDAVVGLIRGKLTLPATEKQSSILVRDCWVPADLQPKVGKELSTSRIAFRDRYPKAGFFALVLNDRMRLRVQGSSEQISDVLGKVERFVSLSGADVVDDPLEPSLHQSKSKGVDVDGDNKLPEASHSSGIGKKETNSVEKRDPPPTTANKNGDDEGEEAANSVEERDPPPATGNKNGDDEGEEAANSVEERDPPPTTANKNGDDEGEEAADDGSDDGSDGGAEYCNDSDFNDDSESDGDGGAGDYLAAADLDDDSDCESSDGDTTAQPVFEEMEVSKEAYQELFPINKPTENKEVDGSFPNIDDLEGGIHKLGEGFFGVTFKSYFRGVPVVLKVSKERSEEANRADYHEWSVSERLNKHPNVLQIIGLCPSFTHKLFPNIGTTALIMPLKHNGGLGDFFKKREPRDGDVVDLAFGMIAGIRSLHEQGVIHRDIACRNFLVDCDGRVQICDFGLTEFLPKGKDFLHNPTKGGAQFPWRYLAPEAYDMIFSRKTDIWMYGLTLIELLTQQRPWAQYVKPSQLKKALNEKTVQLPNMKNFPPVIAEVVRDCLQLDPSDRPTADDIAEKLVRSQFEPEDRDRDEHGNTALHRAVLANSSLEIRKIIKKMKPAMVNTVNFKGETALMMATDPLIRKILLACRRIPSCNSEPSSHMEYFHDIDVFGTLLKLVQKEDVKGVEALAFPGLRNFEKGFLPLPFLRDFSKDDYKHRGDSKGETPLHIAVKTGNNALALVEALLALEIIDEWKTNNEGQTALHVAAIHGNVAVLEKLLSLHDPLEMKDGVELGKSERTASRDYVNIQDSAGKTALHLAALNGNVSATQFLLNYTATEVSLLDANGQSPVFDSVSGPGTDPATQRAVLESFLDLSDVDINATNARGETLLHVVALKGLTQAAESLLKRTDLKVSEREKENSFTPLHLATRELNDGVVRALLSRQGVNVNEPDKFGNTPLHLLAKAVALSGLTAGEPNSSKLEQGAIIAKLFMSRDDLQVNTVGQRQRTPLHDASIGSNVTVATALLSRADVDAAFADEEEQTALHHAASNGCAEIAHALLLREEVHAGVRDESGRTPLHLAAIGNSAEVARALLSREDVDTNAEDERRNTPLVLAVANDSVEVANVLFERSEVDAYPCTPLGNTLLHVAAVHNSHNIAKVLFSRGGYQVDARNKKKETPLHFAAHRGNVEMVKVLIARDDVDVDVDARTEKGYTPLHMAIRGKSVPAATALLEHTDLDVNLRDNVNMNSALHHAAAIHENAHLARVLLSRDDIDPNIRDKDKMTPLQQACYMRNAEMVKVLLTRGDLEANSRDREEQTPIHIAAMSDSLEIARALLSRDDVDANVRDMYQRTPLHCAAMNNGVNVARMLLSMDDVDVNARNEDEHTPLHFASRFGYNVGVLKVLLTSDGVDIGAKDKDGKTALDLAKEKNASECVELLEQEE